jgi:hypothetical protein
LPYLEKGRCVSRIRNQNAVLLEAFKVEADRAEHELLCLFEGISDGDAAGEVRAISRITVILLLNRDLVVFFMYYFLGIETMLERVKEGAFRQFLVHLAVDGEPRLLAPQLELAVTSANPDEIPSVIFNKELYHLSHFHNLHPLTGYFVKP